MRAILIDAHMEDELPRFGSGHRMLIAVLSEKGRGPVSLYYPHGTLVQTIIRKKWDELHWTLLTNDPKEILRRMTYRHRKVVRTCKAAVRANV